VTPFLAILAVVGILFAGLAFDLAASLYLWPGVFATGVRTFRTSVPLPPPALPGGMTFQTDRSSFRVVSSDTLVFRPRYRVLVSSQPGWTSGTVKWASGGAVVTTRFTPIASAGVILFPVALGLIIAMSVAFEPGWADTVTFGIIMLLAVELAVVVNVKIARQWALEAITEYEEYMGLRARFVEPYIDNG
jgi:hypothetical protein